MPSRQNKMTGRCNKHTHKPVTYHRCPNGTRKNKMTGKCETVKKQTLVR